MGCARKHDNLLNKVHAIESLVDNWLQRHRLAAAETDIARDHDLRLGVVDAVAQRGVAEAGINNRMNGTDTRAGQHGNDALHGERHVDDDAVALADAEGFEPIRETAHLPVELAVGNDFFRAILAQPDEGGAIAALRVGMAVERVDGDVGLARRVNHL